MKLYGLRLLSLLNESKLFCHAAWELLLMRFLISTVNRFGFFRRGSIQIYIALGLRLGGGRFVTRVGQGDRGFKTSKHAESKKEEKDVKNGTIKGK
jgi:hypothetical protein